MKKLNRLPLSITKSLPILLTIAPDQRLQNIFQTLDGINFLLNNLTKCNFLVDNLVSAPLIVYLKFLFTISCGLPNTFLLWITLPSRIKEFAFSNFFQPCLHTRRCCVICLFRGINMLDDLFFVEFLFINYCSFSNRCSF